MDQRKSKTTFTKLSLLFLIFFAALLPGSVLAEEQVQPVLSATVREIEFEPDEYTLNVGSSVQTFVEIEPRGASANLQYVSNDPTVVSVDAAGLITALKPGRAVVTATVEGSPYLSDRCEIVVKNAGQTAASVLIDDIDFEPDEARLSVGEIFTPRLEIEPRGASNKTLDFDSTNPAVASVDNQGNIHALSPGFAVIYAIAQDGSYEKADCEIWVVGESTTPSTIFVDDVEFEPDDLYVSVGQSTSLNVEIEPFNATNKTLEFSSSDPSVVSVDGIGNITALAPGRAIVFARATDGSGEADSCKIVVRDGSTPTSVLIHDIDVEPDYLSLAPGQTRNLRVEIEPARATNKNLTYTSSDETVATVDGGVVKAVGSGSAFITVSAQDGSGEFDTCAVVVTENGSQVKIPVDDIDFVEDEFILQVGDKQNVSVKVKPANATNKEYTLENLNEDVLALDDNQTVTALNPGTGIIVVRALDGSGEADVCKIKVVGNPSVALNIKVPVDNVALKSEQVSVSVGKSFALGAVAEPTNATLKTLEYKSNDSSVATVSKSGVIKGVTEGTTIITASAKDGSNKASACVVTVENTSKTVKVTGIRLNKTSQSLKTGQSVKLSATVSPKDASNKALDWKSSAPSVATVKDGTVTAVKKGTATITATAKDGSGKKATCKITVSADKVVKVTSVRLNKTSYSLKAGQSFKLTATVLPTGATTKELNWTSSNTSVATVKNGTVTAVKKGTAVITAAATDGSAKKATCRVTVNAAGNVKVTSIKLSKSTATLKVGQSLKLTANVLPSGATNKALNWTSEDASVATVKNGTITAKKKGTTVITATAKDGSGKKATCKVTVNATGNVKVTSIKLSKTATTLKVGKSYKLSASVLPSGATNKALNWTSEDTSVATVKNGTVTAKKKGTTVITATAKDGSGKKATCKITVS